MAALSIIPSYRFTSRVAWHLYRSGNASSPGHKIRANEKVPITGEGLLLPPPYQELWKDGIFPGISTFDSPVFTTGRLWKYHAYNGIPEGLCVVHDMNMHALPFGPALRHFSWVPNELMKEEKYLELLRKSQAVLAPPRNLNDPNAWVLLPKSDNPPNGGELLPVPESIPFVTAHVLSALRSYIQQLEADAIAAGETDESIEMCERVLWLRNWYHTYIRDYSQSSYVPSLQFLGGVRTYHTVVPRAKALPKQFIPVLHNYVFKMRQHAEELMQKGKEDESLSLCDVLMFVQNIAVTGVLP